MDQLGRVRWFGYHPWVAYGKARTYVAKSKNKISQKDLCKYNKLKLGFGAEQNESLFALACRSLTIDGKSRPDGINHREWVYDNIGFITAYVKKNGHKIKKMGGSYRFMPGYGPDSDKSDISYSAPKTVHVKRKIKPVQKTKPKAGTDYFASKDFLQSYDWRRLRMEALKLHGGRCQCCGASPRTGAVLNVDHIKPRKFYPELALSLDNLQVLCEECNHGKGNWDETDWRKIS